MGLLIGLTGMRGVGKTTIAERMMKDYDFLSAHGAGPMREMAQLYFRMCGYPPSVAWAMTFGDLKDKPMELLPHGEKPRVFLENFGQFMGANLGPEWTLGVALRNMPPGVDIDIVIESVVYEADFLRERGGKIVRVTRFGHQRPKGLHTDGAQGRIQHDWLIDNSGTREQLTEHVHAMMRHFRGQT